MRILLTGGSGDLGTALTPHLQERGHAVHIIDPLRPQTLPDKYFPGSMLESRLLQDAVRNCDLVIHIAGWHGIHAGVKSKRAFWALNVDGTSLLATLWREGLFSKLIHISSSSILKPDSYYGETKREAESIIYRAAIEHRLSAITLRPRGFIPPWNKAVYKSLVEWARYFYSGGVHIQDVVQAVHLSIKKLSECDPGQNHALMVDRHSDFSEDELLRWDASGPGSTFSQRFPEHLKLAQQTQLPIHKKPKTYDFAETQKVLNYEPTYGLKDMLSELEHSKFN